MVTRVKICGITRSEDAALAVDLGASALGFNFYPPSPRYITPERAREIIRTVPPPVMTVGVFADESDLGRISSVAREAGVSAIQLHGPRFPVVFDDGLGFAYDAESAQDAQGRGFSPAAGGFDFMGALAPEGVSATCHYPLIRVVTVDESFDPASLQGLKADAFLLDAFHPTLKGGTGRTIDWTKAREATRYSRVILAGGLTPENVAEAIRQVRPFAVDVASRVESAPGVKDARKLRAFFAAVHEADRNPLP